MLRSLAFLAVLNVLGAAGCQSSPATQGEAAPEVITVLSYNIHYGLGTDGVNDLERIAQVILRSKAGIVGLQEIGNKAMALELGRLTGMQAVFGRSKENDEGYGDAVLCKYPFTWVGGHSIPSASSSRYQAMAIDIDLAEVYGPGAMVRFINTHFDWLDTIGSQEARLATVEVIERGFREGSKLPAILAGDLNATPDSAPLARLHERGWAHGSLGSDLLTWESTQPDRQIDYVLAAPQDAWRVRGIEVMDEPLASDHLPVVIQLELLSR
jgi:endonuclease/exonuclease/phosphatase family metal-dependent hydrolase